MRIQNEDVVINTYANSYTDANINATKRHPITENIAQAVTSTLEAKEQKLNQQINQSAFDTLPQNIQQSLSKAGRVILIANNPSISTDALQAMLRCDDVLVLFNHFVYADFFANNEVAKGLSKLIFFRQIGDSILHFGMPPRRNNVRQLTQMLSHKVTNSDSPLSLLFSNINYQFPTEADNPSPQDDPIATDPNSVPDVSAELRNHIKAGTNSSVLDESHCVVADYPRLENIHSSAPSSGFLIYRLMLAVRKHLAHTLEHNLEIMMVGFNHDKKTDYFWHGHNWEFERQALNPPPEGVTLIKQF